MFLKLSPDSTINQNRIYFYDLNAKLNYTLGQKDRLYLSGYFGQDQLGVGESFGLSWGNATGTARWNHIFNSKMFSNTSLIFSNYNYKIKIRAGANDFQIFSQIRDWNLKQEFQWYANSRNSVRFGLNSIFHTLRPGEITSSSTSSVNSSALQQRYSLENSIFGTNTWKASEKFSLTYGVRLTAFSILGKGDFFDMNSKGEITDTFNYKSGEIVKTYVNPEPRLAASYEFNESASVKASYVRNVQNMHLISNSTSNNPTDKWIASTNLIKPEIADQYSIGYYKNLADNKLKNLKNQITTLESPSR